MGPSFPWPLGVWQKAKPPLFKPLIRTHGGNRGNLRDLRTFPSARKWGEETWKFLLGNRLEHWEPEGLPQAEVNETNKLMLHLEVYNIWLAESRSIMAGNI